MDVEHQFSGTLEEFDDGPVEYSGKIYLEQKEREEDINGNTFLLVHPGLVPEDARYTAARVDVKLRFTDTRRDVTTQVESEVTAGEFRVRTAGGYLQGHYYSEVFDVDSGEHVISANLRKDLFLPDGLRPEGDECFLGFELQYDRERSENVIGSERIAEKRRMVLEEVRTAEYE